MNDLVIPQPASCRKAGAGWAAIPLRERLAVIRRARRLMAARAAALAATVARPAADTLVAEVLPLLEAAKFLERRAARLLAPRHLWGGRPAWLFGVRAELRREPLGVVLILAPGNYPLFLPGAQALQALAAGNAVCIKPAPGGVAAAEAFVVVMAERRVAPRRVAIARGRRWSRGGCRGIRPDRPDRRRRNRGPRAPGRGPDADARAPWSSPGPTPSSCSPAQTSGWSRAAWPMACG